MLFPVHKSWTDPGKANLITENYISKTLSEHMHRVSGMGLVHFMYQVCVALQLYKGSHTHVVWAFAGDFCYRNDCSMTVVQHTYYQM